MSLVVEDGSVVSGADSFVTLADARTKARSLGLSLPANDSDAEIALRNGARYVGRYENRFYGTRVSSSQTLSYPRNDAKRCFGVDCIDIANDAIPQEVIDGQVLAAVEYGAGVSVTNNTDGSRVKLKEVVGAVKKEYFDSGTDNSVITLTASIEAIKPLMSSGGGMTARSLRV